jgi:3-hydroxyisobutyrate dehydrogenase
MSIEVGFVGLGTLGGPMAMNLVKKGFNVHAYDLRQSALDELKAQGATIAAALPDLAKASQFIFTMVRDAAQTEKVVLGNQGLLQGMRKGATLIVTSTVGRACILKLKAALDGAGCKLVDAPVSGSLPGAQQGTLSLMVGADAPVLEEARPVLAAVAKSIVRAGGPGAGQAAKIANNLVFCISVVGLLEGLKLGIDSGIEPDVLREIFRASSADSYALRHWEQLGGRWKGQLAGAQSELPLMCKDLRLAMLMADDLHLNLPIGAIVAGLCGTGKAVGHDDPRT